MEKATLHLTEELAPELLFNFNVDMAITNTVATMFAATILAAVVVMFAARRPSLVPGKLQNAIEAFVQFIRNDIIVSMMGKEGLPWFPFLATIFFFIMFSNVLGLVPGSSTPTSRLSVPLILSLIVFFSVHVQGISRHGFFKYFGGWVPPGLPVWVRPVVFLLEVISAFAKPFSLTVRLFANMLAGHIVILVFLSFAMLFGTVWIATVSLPFAIMMMMLEILFSVIQAYVFTMLSAMYIGAAIHSEH